MPSARYVHPEFGYFCPTPRFRRKLCVALAGMVLGAIGVALLRAGPDLSSAHSPASGSAAMMARVVSATEIGPEAGRASQAVALGLRPALSQSPRACEDNTWAYLDGKCAAGKERKLRIVRVPTNRPAMATIALGRTSAPAARAAEPASALVADGRKGDFSPSRPVQAAAAADATEPAQQQPIATPKKSQRTAHSQNSRRQLDVRMTPAPARGYASVPDQRHGPFGGGFFFFR